MFLNKIRIREVNRYLRPVIKELLKKHEKVTNPDFEDELEGVAGIRYRMAKTYLYSPKPWQVVKDNSKIQKFVLEKRKQYWKRRLIPPVCTLLVIIATPFIYWKIKTIPPSVNKTAFLVSIPEYGVLLRLGDSVETLKNIKGSDKLKCKPVPPSKAEGAKDYVVCLYSFHGFNSLKPNIGLSYAYNTTNKIVYQYLIYSTMPKVTLSLKSQTKDITANGFALTGERITEEWSSTVESTYIKENQELKITNTPGGNFTIQHQFID